jgi:hypothetical protein
LGQQCGSALATIGSNATDTVTIEITTEETPFLMSVDHLCW